MDGWIWITWERHRRTRQLCAEFGLRLLEKDVQLPRILRHPTMLVWTFFTILRERPQGLIVQSPSVVLALQAVLLRRLFGYTLYIDSHNAGLHPMNPRLDWLGFLYRYLQRAADLTIVTSEDLAATVRANGGTPFVLEDRLPELPEVRKQELAGRCNVVSISTFAEDEPFAAIIEATRLLDDDYRVYMTGNSKRLPRELAGRLPANLVLTGFVPDDEYVSLLGSADVVLDLTHLDNCLVCGAYESIAVGTPMVLTDNPASRKYFSRGVVYTRNDPQEIRDAVVAAVGDAERLRGEIERLRSELTADWRAKREQLVRRMGAVASSSGTPMREGG